MLNSFLKVQVVKSKLAELRLHSFLRVQLHFASLLLIVSLQRKIKQTRSNLHLEFYRLLLNCFRHNNYDYNDYNYNNNYDYVFTNAAT